MLLSIVSVIKDPSIGFDKTYASVLEEFSQSDEVEYLIKEWDSKTAWNDAIEHTHMEGQMVVRKYISQDRGVFDGMNQAIEQARGRWVMLLNAGDWLADGYGAKCLQFLKENDAADYAYSDGVTVDVSDGREFLRRAPDCLQLSDFLNQAPILHPCLLIKNEVLAGSPFCLDCDLAADFDMMVELVARREKGRHLPTIGAFILSGGLSEQRRIRAKRQALVSMLRNSPSLKFRFRACGAFVRFLISHILIIYLVRPIGPLRRWAKSQTGGAPAGTYSESGARSIYRA